MNAVYPTVSISASLFSDADLQFGTMKETLTSEEFQSKSEADVQRWLATEQKELMRRLLQSHLTLRGQAEAQGLVTDAQGVHHTHIRPEKSRKLETIFGTVDIVRTGYSRPKIGTLYPVDASLNLPKTRYSHEVDRQIAKIAARLSFDETLETIGSLTGAHVPKRQAEEAVQRAATDFETFYSGTELDSSGSTSKILVLSFDQKGVILHKEDLSEATRKAAENSRHKMDTRLSPGEKRGRKRMATVASVYTVAPYARSAQDVVAGLRNIRPANRTPRPRPEQKRVWARLDRSLGDVISDAFDEALTRDRDHQKHWIALVDGDKKLRDLVRAEARRRGVEVTLVLDFIHALEYLWKAAHVFFEKGTPEIEAWVLERVERMLEGRISNVVAGMTRMATMRGLSKKDRKPVDQAAAYLLKRRRWGMMNYDELLHIGAPIATGVIEGACRHLIADRMDITGARWRLPSAEAVLRLRSILSSGDFDEYWRFHEDAEAHRNHLSGYAREKVPPLQRRTRKCHLKVVPSVD